MAEKSKCVFTGSGGQGVVTAGIILAEAAVLYENLHAVQTQVYGAAARGGATRADVIISETEIFYPKVSQANLLVCLTQEAYMRFARIIRPGGLLLTDPRFVRIEQTVDATQVELPLYRTVMEKINNPIVLNICMLGAVIALTGAVHQASVMKVLQDRIAAAYLRMNHEALELGLELGTAVA